MRKDPQPNEIYRHFKGNLYRIITLATHTETRETMVVYQALYGDYQAYVRELSMFMSEVDSQKYPEIQQRYRFELIPQIAVNTDNNTTINTVIDTAAKDTDKRSQVQDAKLEKETAKEQEAQAASPSESEEPDMDPVLIQFLDAKTYHERLNLLAALHPRITDEMITTMAVVLDLEVDGKDVEERYAALKNCLLMMEKYECSRLR